MTLILHETFTSIKNNLKLTALVRNYLFYYYLNQITIAAIKIMKTLKTVAEQVYVIS